MLKSFDFRGNIRFIWLKHIPLLEKVSLTENSYPPDAGNYDFVNFLKSFSVVEYLKLDSSSLKLFAGGAGRVPRRLPFDLSSVKSLYVSDIYLDDEDVVSCSLCVISSFPNLHYMEIEVHDCYEDIPALECLEVEGYADVALNCLRKVKLIGDRATEPGMQLVKILFAKSPMLMRMLIDTWINDDNPSQLSESLCETYELATLLEEFQRASPKAEVFYNVDYDLRLDVHRLKQKFSITSTMICVWTISCNEAYDI